MARSQSCKGMEYTLPTNNFTIWIPIGLLYLSGCLKMLPNSALVCRLVDLWIKWPQYFKIQNMSHNLVRHSQRTEFLTSFWAVFSKIDTVERICKQLQRGQFCSFHLNCIVFVQYQCKMRFVTFSIFCLII